MICFPNAKINIGLNILEKRTDGYHNIETIFYPIKCYDILEIIKSDNFELINYGIDIDCSIDSNLCTKAYKALAADYNLSPVKIILYKIIPFGTGLGAGSSNAAHTLILLNKIFNLQLSLEQLSAYASKIGADCSFFIYNTTSIARGIGNELTKIAIPQLNTKYILLCFSDIKINTAEAYKNIKPSFTRNLINETVNKDIYQWKFEIKNDFEDNIFIKYPQLSSLKQNLYDIGAIYAQMTGSGSAIYGIFDEKPDTTQLKDISSFMLIYQ